MAHIKGDGGAETSHYPMNVEHHKGSEEFSENIIFTVGNENRISF